MVSDMEQSRLQISVENFGPIREGTVEFKPLTVFIGPNNSGKSYMATLMYALFQSLSGNGFSPSLPPFHLDEFAKKQSEVIRARRLENQEAEPRLSQTMARYFLDEIHGDVRTSVDKYMGEVAGELPGVIRDCFGFADFNQLASKSQNSKQSLAITLTDVTRGQAVLNVRQRSPSASPDWKHSPLPDIDIPADIAERSGSFIHGALPALIWNEFLQSLGIPIRNAHYLPAGRSGILQGWQLIASMAVQTLSRQAGIRRLEIPSLTGVTGDFLQTLLERVLQRMGLRNPRRRTRGAYFPEMNHALSSLKRDLLKGTISVSDDPSQDPTMYYETGSLRIPVQHASSMVAELAPLYLWIERVLRPGDVLIIDEPEAHLHPANQRLVASVLVRLMNAGVKVVCATHSSLILHQMSNHILAASATEKKRAELGFGKHDLLKLEDIGGYSFRICEDGARIEPLEIDDTFGVSEDDFVKVAEEIGEETYDLVT